MTLSTASGLGLDTRLPSRLEDQQVVGKSFMTITTFQYSASSDDAVQGSSSKIARGMALHTALCSGYKMSPCNEAFLFP